MRKPTKNGGSLLRKVDHGPSCRKLHDFHLNRTQLYDSGPVIDQRDWNVILQKSQVLQAGPLRKLRKEMLADCSTNQPKLPFLDKLQDRKSPVMICEFGFGDTTYRLLEWCNQHDGYLVTVDMPIASQEMFESEEYPELYWWGVDRYHKKYNHCINLLNNDIAQQRWLWINDDIYQIAKRIVQDSTYRQRLFLKGKIDYFYEDAIHDNQFHQDLFRKISPFMNKNGVFTGDDNAPTHIIR